jgi:hypothetical protein
MSLKDYFMVNRNNALLNGQVKKIISWLIEIMP